MKLDPHKYRGPHQVGGSCCSLAATTFHHSQASSNLLWGTTTQNRWYDDDCQWYNEDSRLKIPLTQRGFSRGHYSHTSTSLCDTSYDGRREPSLVSSRKMFLCQDWRLFQECHSPTSIISITTWSQYATSLQQMLDEQNFLATSEHSSIFSREDMVCNAIDIMKIRKDQDHDGLMAEHFIHVRDLFICLIGFFVWDSLIFGQRIPLYPSSNRVIPWTQAITVLWSNCRPLLQILGLLTWCHVLGL